MPPVIFHILDALSRDQISTIKRETEDEQEIELEFEEDGGSYGDSETHANKKQQRSLVIHLFGMTAEG